MSKILVHFIDEDKTAIVDASWVPESSRFEGAVCTVKWSSARDATQHAAKVLKISDDIDVLEEVESSIADAIDQKLKEQGSSKRRLRKPTARSKQAATATEREVSRAVQERPKLSAKQAEKKKRISQEKKQAAILSTMAQQKLDTQIIDNLQASAIGSAETVKRSLFHVEHSSDTEDQDNLNVTESTDINSNSLQLFSKLKNLVNPTTQEFVSTLSLFMGLGQQSTCTSGGSVQKEYLEVLPVKEGEVSVELTKDSKVFIGLKSKTSIKNNHPNDPLKMLYDLLEALFSKDIFKIHITARGTARGSKGIQDHVLKAMLAFINRNVDKSKRLSEAGFIKAINRKANQWREEMTSDASGSKLKRKSPKSTSAKGSPSPTIFGESPIKSPRFKTPGSVKKTPKSSKSRVISPKKSPSPAKSPKEIFSPAKSPWKVQRALSPVNVIGQPSSGTAQINNSPWKIQELDGCSSASNAVRGKETQLPGPSATSAPNQGQFREPQMPTHSIITPPPPQSHDYQYQYNPYHNYNYNHHSQVYPNYSGINNQSAPYPNQSGSHNQSSPYPNQSGSHNQSAPYPNQSGSHNQSAPYPNHSGSNNQSAPHPNFHYYYNNPYQPSVDNNPQADPNLTTPLKSN